MKQAEVKIHCEEDSQSYQSFEKEAAAIERLMQEGYEVEVKIIVDGTRGVSYSVVELV